MRLGNLEEVIKGSQFFPNQCYFPASVHWVGRHPEQFSSLTFHPLGTVWKARSIRTQCHIFLKSPPLDWDACTQSFCLPPAHPSSPNHTCLKLTAPCEDRRMVQVYERSLQACRSPALTPTLTLNLQKEPWATEGVGSKVWQSCQCPNQLQAFPCPRFLLCEQRWEFTILELLEALNERYSG